MTQMNLSMKQKRTLEQREQVAKGVAVGGGMRWEFGVSRCKLLYIKWINSKVLLYSKENCIQYPMISHMEKNILKECTYIYVTELLCWTVEINITFKINYISI